MLKLWKVQRAVVVFCGEKRRVVVEDHKVGLHRCQIDPKKPRGMFTPNDDAVKTITKDGLRKAVQREAQKVVNKTSEVR